MIYSLKVSLSPLIKDQSSRNKKVWNFVKSDILKLLNTSELQDKFEVTKMPLNYFFLKDKISGQNYTIGYDLAFTDNLEISLDDHPFLSLILAIVIRLEHSYKGAFKVFCDAYPVVNKAIELLQKELQFKVTRNALSTFIDYPIPGKKPVKDKPLTSAEIRHKVVLKKRAEGKQAIMTWLTKSVKKRLDEFCKIHGLNMEEALNKIIPIGINTTSSVFINFSPTTKEANSVVNLLLDAKTKAEA